MPGYGPEHWQPGAEHEKLPAGDARRAGKVGGGLLLIPGRRVDDINEKMYDFEANKRNNLIFYGIANEARETQPALLQKVIKH